MNIKEITAIIALCFLVGQYTVFTMAFFMFKITTLLMSAMLICMQTYLLKLIFAQEVEAILGRIGRKR